MSTSGAATAALIDGDSQPRDVAHQQPTLVLDDALLRGPRGVVFGPLHDESTAQVTVVLGARGSGRTSLLLTLGGRMRLTAGDARALGLDVRREAAALRRASGLVGFDAIDALESAATVREALRERLAWRAPWYRVVRTPTDRQVDSLLEPVFGLLGQPAPDTAIRDLTEGQDLLVRAALALIDAPRLLLVDDLDDVKDPRERAAVASRLEALTHTGVVLVAGSSDERDLSLFTNPAVVTLARPAA